MDFTSLMNRYLPSVSLIVLLMVFSRPVSADEFPAPFNTEPEGQYPPSPEEMVQLISLPPGFNATLFAGEPAVQQPICIDFDDRGRLWVAENYSYSGGPYETRLRDRIIILEDTNGDGRHDSRKVFWDQGWMLTSLTWGFGGLWVLNDGTLSFIPDRDGDDVPDSEPVVMLDGWTKGAGHNFVNGLIWGNDGWLYGRHGITDTSWPGTPDTPLDERQPMNCGIWRFHPVRRLFEPVCHGTTNPWGLDYNEQAQFFMTNNVQGHLWHVIPGAHYKRMFGQDFNPHLYELMDQTADHYHWDTTARWSDSRDGKANDLGGGHSHCGGLIYLGDNFPDEYRGKIFMCNTHGRRINVNRLQRQGSGYVGLREPDFMMVSNPWFRGVDIKTAPDGTVYVADWADNGECHDHDGIHRTSGRIYRVAYGTPEPLPTTNLAELDNASLTKMALDASEWFARRATRLLQERSQSAESLADESLRETQQSLLAALKSTGNERKKLRALQTLNAADLLQNYSESTQPHGNDQHGSQSNGELLQLLTSSDSDEFVQAAAVRLFVESAVNNSDHAAVPDQGRQANSGELVGTLSGLVHRTGSGLVLLTVAGAGQKLDRHSRLLLAEALIHRIDQRDENIDQNLELMTWYLLEPVIGSELDLSSSAALASNSPKLLGFISRKLASMSIQGSVTEALIQRVAVTKDVSIQLAVLSGMVAGYTGRRNPQTPESWAACATKLADSKDRDIAALALQLSTIFGNRQALSELRGIVRDGLADPQIRERAIEALAEADDRESLPSILNLLSDRAVGNAAIRAVARFDHPDIARELLRRFGSFQSAGRSLAIDVLSSRESSALQLISAIENGQLQAQELSAAQVRQLQTFGNQKIRTVLDAHWGIVQDTPEARLAAAERWKQQLTPEVLSTADDVAGAALYKKSCANCHKLYGEGGTIGPDLTGSNRNNLDYLLMNIIDPSAVVPRQFTTSVVALGNGRIITGVITAQTEQVTTIQTDKEQLVVANDDIEEITATNKSLMPDGLLDNLTESEARDLLAFIMKRR